ncbi:MAG: CDP-glycerol glycerophosphotransferase family protein [Polyangiaceae bacterium]
METASSLLKSTRIAARIRGDLRRRAALETDPERQERFLLGEGDVATIGEYRLYVEQVRRAIRAHRLRAVVTANVIDGYLSATTEACRREGVPHICVQNSGLEAVAVPRFADCDLFFAQSRSLARFLQSHGAIGQVEAVGLPYYDTLVTALAERGHGAVMDSFPHLRGKRIIGVTTQTELVNTRPILEQLITLAERRDDIAIVLKLHPREPADAHADIRSRLERTGRGVHVHHVPLTRFLADCDLLVSSTSVTILWALVMGVRPISYLDKSWSVFTHELDFMRPEVTTTFEDPIATASFVEKALDDPTEQPDWRARRADFLQEYVTGADGQASERILDHILRLL